MKKLIWLVEHPTHQYKEDVKLLALQANLQVIDANFAKSFPADRLVDKKDAPKLTKA